MKSIIKISYTRSILIIHILVICIDIEIDITQHTQADEIILIIYFFVELLKDAVYTWEEGVQTTDGGIQDDAIAPSV